MIKDKLDEIRDKAKDSLNKIGDTQTLKELRVKFLGKKGEITQLMKTIGEAQAKSDLKDICLESEPLLLEGV